MPPWVAQLQTPRHPPNPLRAAGGTHGGVGCATLAGMDLPRAEIDPDGLLEFSVVFTDRSLNHMSARFTRAMQSLLSTLRKTYAAQAVALIPGGGSCAMEAVARQLAGGKDVVVDHTGVPHAVFGIPEIGAVGMTEEEAQAACEALDFYETVFNPMRNQLSGRDERVHIKLIVDAVTDRIVGCHILGDEAPELLPEDVNEALQFLADSALLLA